VAARMDVIFAPSPSSSGASSGYGRSTRSCGDSPGLHIQLGRDHVRFTTTLEVPLEGVLDERTAYPLQERINTSVRTAGSDLPSIWVTSQR
jgi:hypothetical protein